MEKILSQDEINALFSAMASEDLRLGSTQAGAARNVTEYHFRGADRISQEQIRSVHLLYDFFGRNFSSSLSAYLRAFAEVTLISVDQMPFSEFLKLLPDPTLFASISLRPLDSSAVLEVNPSLVFPMIDMLLGGPGLTPQTERTLTEIEMTIIEGVLKLALKDLREAWRPVVELELFLEGCETKPQAFQIVAPGETVVTVSFRINLGDNSGMLNFCIPSRVLKNIRDRFDHQWHIRRQPPAAGEAGRILDLIRGAHVTLAGQTVATRLTVNDLVGISSGDVVALDQRISEPVLLSVCGIPKFWGRIIVRHGKKAFEVTGQYTA